MPLSDFVSVDTNCLIIGTTHTVRFFNGTKKLKYKAKLCKLGNFKCKLQFCLIIAFKFLFKGTRQECDDYINNLCNYEVNEALKNNINKNSKRSIDAVLHEQSTIEISFLKNENETLLKKINELEKKELEWEQEREKKNTEINAIKKEMVDLKQRMESQVNSKDQSEFYYLFFLIKFW